jgi:hypothetical protein
VPTFERTARFDRDLSALSEAQQRRFRVAVAKFVADLRSGRFRKSLRVRGIEGAPGIFEMTWAPDGRATFQYGESRGAGPHLIWRRVGTHGVFGEP